jgi:hydrogenase nickel incorporation protein HypB
MSSPGSGKTTLVERTIGAVAPSTPVCVVEGDQETLLDAERIRATGCPVVQINTGAGCHLDADMLWRGLQDLDPAAGALVVVENVASTAATPYSKSSRDCGGPHEPRASDPA